MVEVFGAKTTMHFSFKDLGLNVGLSGLFLDSPEVKLQDYFWTVRSWIMKLIFVLSLCTILCVFLKVNNMSSCENHVVMCAIEVLALIA